MVAQTSVCDLNISGPMEEVVHTYYRRNLPHWHPIGRSIFLTWRLDGSLPRTVVEKLRLTRNELKVSK